MSLWPFSERRRKARHSVDWDALLRCSFVDLNATIQVKIVEISLSGARLSLEGMLVGPYHLMVGGDGTAHFEISILTHEGTIKQPVDFRWYDFDDEKRLFSVGIEFRDMNRESESLLKKSLRK